ncbi:MAG: heparan-alpha-glucosaminide N-acetyltransferase domain-containing protein [Ferruginibacter sp.]
MTNNKQPRFDTLDVFRGMTVFLMIVVNTPGSGATPYKPLLHADWNGCTLTDLVFPSFLFAVGNALSFVKDKWQQQTAAYTLAKILKRSFLIFLAGYLLTWYTTMHWVDGRLVFERYNHVRIFAVLQRIALCYMIAAMMIYFLPASGIIIASACCLLMYWFLLIHFGDPGQQLTIEGNVIRKIDLAVLGEQHMYRERGIVFDPEGLLSTIPATVNVLIGYLSGMIIRRGGKTFKSIVRLSMWGCVLVIAGLLWNYVFPLNKKLWTSSYALFTSGIGMLVVAILFYLVEMLHWKKLVAFFSPMGKNPLFIYVLSNLFIFFIIINMKPGKIFVDWINELFFQKIFPGAFGSLVFALCFTMICWLVAWLLDRKKIYIRL